MEKNRPNFCSYFESSTRSDGGTELKSDTDHLDAAEELFKL